MLSSVKAPSKLKALSSPEARVASRSYSTLMLDLWLCLWLHWPCNEEGWRSGWKVVVGALRFVVTAGAMGLGLGLGTGMGVG